MSERPNAAPEHIEAAGKPVEQVPALSQAVPEKVKQKFTEIFQAAMNDYGMQIPADQRDDYNKKTTAVLADYSQLLSRISDESQSFSPENKAALEAQTELLCDELANLLRKINTDVYLVSQNNLSVEYGDGIRGVLESYDSLKVSLDNLGPDKFSEQFNKFKFDPRFGPEFDALLA